MPGGLLTDLYELNMAASYLRRGMTGPATFSLFARRLPAHRGFLIAADLEDCLAFLETFAFTDADLAWLAEKQGFTVTVPARALGDPAPVPVTVSPALAALRDQLTGELATRRAQHPGPRSRLRE